MTPRSAPITIVFANFKGGCGKTSLSCLLALLWAQRDERIVALSDRDPQQSAHAFVRHQAHPRLHHPGQGPTPDLILVDTPAGVMPRELVATATGADLLVVPLKPMPTDVISTRQLARELSPQLRTRLVFNMVDSRTAAFRARAALAEQIGLPALSAYLSNRISFGYALDEGLGALGAPAYAELDAISDEILGLVAAPPARS